MSANNSCHFYGRITGDLNLQTVNPGPNSFSKLFFTVAVDRQLSQKDKETKKQGGDVKTADFIPIEVIGKRAEVIAQYFQKGSPIAIVGRYNEWASPQPDGTKKYGSKFILDDFSFNLSDPNANGGQSPSYSQNNNQNSNNVFQVDESDIPF